MEFLQLQYFECVARFESVSKAAARLHISQPSLSASILRLERELGAPLFDRQHRKMTLTPYGIYYLNTARRILSLVNRSKVPPASGQITSRIAIAFQNYHDGMVALIERFRRKNPDIAFTLYASKLEEPFSCEAYDFIVGNDHAHFSGFAHHLDIEPRGYYAVLPRAHPLAGRTDLALHELAGEPLAFLQDELGNFEYAYHLCVESGFIPQCVFSANDGYYKLRFLAQGNSCGIIPTGWVAPYTREEKLRVIPLRDFAGMNQIRLYWTDMAAQRPAHSQFLTFVRQTLSGGKEGERAKMQE